MGHASETTTEIYAQFSLRRLEKDFPSIVGNQNMSEVLGRGHDFGGHIPPSPISTAVVF